MKQEYVIRESLIKIQRYANWTIPDLAGVCYYVNFV